MQYLPFRIAGRDFVIDASRVRAIVPFDRLDPAGHGGVVPVFDLREKLRLPPVYYGRQALLVVVETNSSDSGQAGFVADYVSDVIKSSENDCRNGKLHARGRPKWILDPDSLSIAHGAERVNS